MSAEIGILIGIILALLSVFYVLRPLRETPTLDAGDETLLADLQARREAAYQVLRDLDNDFAQGKMSEDDYRPMRVQALAQAAEIVAQLDKTQLAQAQHTPAPPRPPDGLIPRKATTKARNAQAVNSTPHKPSAKPSSPSLQPTATQSSGFCPSCGAAHAADDAFCRKCGKALR